jgi:hypothetical protein
MQFMNVYDTPFITVSCCQGPCLRWELLLWQKARTVQLPKWKGNLVEMKEVLTHRREDHLTICMYKEKVQVRLADHGLMALFKTETRLLKNINGKSTLIFHYIAALCFEMFRNGLVTTIHYLQAEGRGEEAS